MVEDRPDFAEVHNISHGGVYAWGMGVVRFGPFSDAEPRVLTYDAYYPPGTAGVFEFTGQGFANGVVTPIIGDQQMVLPEFPPPPCFWLRVVSVAAGVGVLIEVHGDSGQVYGVQASEDLAVWTTLGSVTNSAAVSTFVDPKVLVNGHRFYRAQAVLPAEPLGDWAYQGFEARGSLIVTGTVSFATSTNPVVGTWDFQPVSSPYASGHFVGQETFSAGEVSGSSVTVRKLRAIANEFVMSGQMVGDDYTGAWQLNVEGPPETGSFVAHRLRR
jgi:hypothetical protein